MATYQRSDRSRHPFADAGNFGAGGAFAEQARIDQLRIIRELDERATTIETRPIEGESRDAAFRRTSAIMDQYLTAHRPRTRDEVFNWSSAQAANQMGMRSDPTDHYRVPPDLSTAPYDRKRNDAIDMVEINGCWQVPPAGWRA
jgi:hypothetical protein